MLKVHYILYIDMHILATYGERMYINMSEVGEGEEWVLRRHRRAYDFRLEVPLLDENVETSQEMPTEWSLPSLLSMVSSVTNSHTGTVSSLCSKIQYCQHKKSPP